MYQCAPGVPAVSPGWSVFGNTTNANTVLSNTCSAGGSIGDYVFTDGQAGAVTENGESGSQVGLRIDVPGGAPGVTIHAIKAEVIASAVTGDDAFLEFASAGQSLPGAAELPYGGGSAYTATESWTLPQGARDFEAYVNCSTDRSSPTCDFADSTAVPALSQHHAQPRRRHAADRGKRERAARGSRSGRYATWRARSRSASLAATLAVVFTRRR